ncbi:MAG: hypothetical protein QM635_03915 [Microbacteriaceae bacterium]
MTDPAPVTASDSDSPRRRPDGPPPGAVAAVALGFTIAAAVAYGFDARHWIGFFTFASSVPLGVCAATVHARQLKLGVRVPGPGIGLVGGVTASVMLAIAGLLGLASTRVAGIPASVSDLVTEVVFLLGGVGFATGVGLLIAGIAVPATILRLLPRWLARAGLAIGLLGEVSFLCMLWGGLDVVLPIVRFGGLAWLVTVGFLLPRDRRDAPTRARAARR